MSFTIKSRPSLIKIQLPTLHHANLQAAVLRLDEVHDVVSGNKWYKLKEYIARAKALGKSTLITFGGAYSNHIVATAAACAAEGLQAFGIVRGERPTTLSATLIDAENYGMQLFYVSREAYRQKTIPYELSCLIDEKDYLLINEGGYGVEGMLGASSILSTIDYAAFSHIMCAVGTGTTLAGLSFCANPEQKVIGISVLKNNLELDHAVRVLLPKERQDNFRVLHDFHFGGYAKKTPELLKSMNVWYQETGIPSDFVYTGKLFAAFKHLCAAGFYPGGSNILLIHSGGLQGNRSLPEGTLIF